MNKYEKQASQFIKKTGIKIEAEYLGHNFHFEDDKERRAIFQITISRNGKPSYTFQYGQSIINSYFITAKETDGTLTGNKRTTTLNKQQHAIQWKGFSDAVAKGGGHIQGIHYLTKRQKPPTDYDILSCLNAYGVGTFREFCQNYGYNKDSQKAIKIYLTVQEEYSSLLAIFNPKEMEELIKIT